jgi:hypothetical protein
VELPNLEPDHQTIDNALGRADWRAAWEKAGPKRVMDEFLTDSLGESMKTLGYLYDGRHETHRIFYPGTGVLLYRLVLFSTHDLARSFWKKSRKYTTSEDEPPTLFPMF